MAAYHGPWLFASWCLKKRLLFETFSSQFNITSCNHSSIPLFKTCYLLAKCSQMRPVYHEFLLAFWEGCQGVVRKSIEIIHDAEISLIWLIKNVGEMLTDLMPLAPYCFIVQKPKLNLNPTITRESSDLHIKITFFLHEHFYSVIENIPQRIKALIERNANAIYEYNYSLGQQSSL